MQDALTKKDSCYFGIGYQFKTFGWNFNDPDIEVNVEKGVVFISIADKLFSKAEVML
jgi:chemotaxis protein MotB